LLAELCTISTIVRPGRQVPGLLIYRYDASSGSLHAGRALVEGLRVVRADLVVTDVGELRCRRTRRLSDRRAQPPAPKDHRQMVG